MSMSFLSKKAELQVVTLLPLPQLLPKMKWWVTWRQQPWTPLQPSTLISTLSFPFPFPPSHLFQVGLWQQYWSALDMCMSTVTPLFLALVLGLYAVSAVTKVATWPLDLTSLLFYWLYTHRTLLFSFLHILWPWQPTSTTSRLMQVQP